MTEINTAIDLQTANDNPGGAQSVQVALTRLRTICTTTGPSARWFRKLKKTVPDCFDFSDGLWVSRRYLVEAEATDTNQIYAENLRSDFPTSTSEV
ncbi:hypothetical protein KUV62_17430 [Salipiger bermudensis]|uniref:hypothetical protein n=1 Tax=Salipiger bermudensis TaxID=344736 RepID=UPI001C9935B9|nr:hypothetical protein [Salipiger bermudensis]MBY6005707.1 hypothetical protein [Salipiger bermudensis]